jgi:hypothetical protein
MEPWRHGSSGSRKGRINLTETKSEELLWSELSDAELADVARELGQIGAALADVQDVFDQAKEARKTEKKRLEERRLELEEAARMGKIQRAVATRVFMDYQTSTVRYYRNDTGEQFKTRPMDVAELQIPMEFPKAPDGHTHVLGENMRCLCGWTPEHKVDADAEIAAGLAAAQNGSAQIEDEKAEESTAGLNETELDAMIDAQKAETEAEGEPPAIKPTRKRRATVLPIEGSARRRKSAQA